MASKQQRRWTRWLWQADATHAQKWVVGVLLVLVVAAAVPLLVSRNFVPSPQWQGMAAYAVALSMLVAGGGLVLGYRSGQWRPAGPWQGTGPVQRAGLVLGMVVFMGLLWWLVWAQTLPMVYTQLLGHDAQERATVQAQRSAGRYRCRYQFKVQEIQYLFFEFCISREDFAALPTEPIPAVLQLRRSKLGKTVQGVVWAAPPAQQAQDAAEAGEAKETHEDADAAPLCVTTVTVGDSTTTSVGPC